VNPQSPTFNPAGKIDLRQFLRARTRDAHLSVDRAFGALPLSTSVGYRLFLRTHARALLPLEFAIELSNVHSILPDWGERARRHALAADLRVMGGSDRGIHVAPVSWPASFLLGVLYTLEGSRLGSRTILGLLEGTGFPTAFLRHGEGLRLWPKFCATLSAIPLEKVDLAELANGAQHAFAVFERAAFDLALPSED
jgi:heme oxygenase